MNTEVVSSDINSYSLDRFELFITPFENSEHHRTTLRKMLLQHNIRIMSLYYNIVHLNRMAHLIGGTEQETED